MELSVHFQHLSVLIRRACADAVMRQVQGKPEDTLLMQLAETPAC